MNRDPPDGVEAGAHGVGEGPDHRVRDELPPGAVGLVRGGPIPGPHQAGPAHGARQMIHVPAEPPRHMAQHPQGDRRVVAERLEKHIFGHHQEGAAARCRDGGSPPAVRFQARQFPKELTGLDRPHHGLGRALHQPVPERVVLRSAQAVAGFGPGRDGGMGRHEDLHRALDHQVQLVARFSAGADGRAGRHFPDRDTPRQGFQGRVREVGKQPHPCLDGGLALRARPQGRSGKV